MKNVEWNQAIEKPISLLEAIMDDQTASKGLRREIEQIAYSLKDSSRSLDLKCSIAIAKLEVFSEDPNVPPRSRAAIWQIIGDLSTLS